MLSRGERFASKGAHNLSQNLGPTSREAVLLISGARPEGALKPQSWSSVGSSARRSERDDRCSRRPVIDSSQHRANHRPDGGPCWAHVRVARPILRLTETHGRTPQHPLLPRRQPRLR
jgi:hypothetical protein